MMNESIVSTPSKLCYNLENGGICTMMNENVKVVKKQKVFYIHIETFMKFDEYMKSLQDELDNGWIIVNATPVLGNGNTARIIYILEKEETADDNV